MPRKNNWCHFTPSTCLFNVYPSTQHEDLTGVIARCPLPVKETLSPPSLKVGGAREMIFSRDTSVHHEWMSRVAMYKRLAESVSLIFILDLLWKWSLFSLGYNKVLMNDKNIPFMHYAFGFFFIVIPAHMRPIVWQKSLRNGFLSQGFI